MSLKRLLPKKPWTRYAVKVVMFLREIFYIIERSELKHLLNCMQNQESFSLVVASEKLKHTQDYCVISALSLV